MKPSFRTPQGIWLALFIGLCGAGGAASAQAIVGTSPEPRIVAAASSEEAAWDATLPLSTPAPVAARRAKRPGRRQDMMMPIIGRFFPNPTREWLFVELDGQGTVETPAQLYDALGRLVRVFSLRSGTTRVSLADLPPGTYMLHSADSWGRIVLE